MSSPAPETTAGLAAVRAWCGWHIAPSQTETVKVESPGGRTLLLPSLHVTDVIEIRNEESSSVAGYRWRENGVVRGWWACEEQYEVDLTHGYDSMPIELQGIVEQLDGAGIGRTPSSRSAGPFSESYGATTDLESQPFSVRAVIARYALPPRP